MLIDLHAHYPMHLVPPGDGSAHAGLRGWRSARFRAGVTNLLSKLFNYEGPGDSPSVTVELMREGGVGAALSVLYDPFDEMDVDKRYGSRPDARYLKALISQLELAEQSVAGRGDAILAHSPAELEQALGAGRSALVHCVEGGFHLGSSEQQVGDAVAELAGRGVAYITIAHLFWRDVATNAPALPFLPDALYRVLFRQPREGLSELGRAAAAAMLDAGVLIDITHMSDRSVADTLELVDRRDPAKSVPVIASHGACRALAEREYNLADDTIRRIGERNGLVGLICCPHYLLGGSRQARKANDLETSVDALCRHVDHIAAITGSLDHVAIGSDLDGFIKPALRGLEHLGRMRALEDRLRTRYGADADRICSANVLRVLHAGWGVPAPAGG